MATLNTMGKQTSYDPSTFGWQVMGDITPYTYTGPGATPIVGTTFPGGVAKGTEHIWDSILSSLVPHIEGGLEQSSCWGASNRNIAGKDAKSFHAYGLALDINASYNGRGLKKGRTGKYVLTDDASQIATDHNSEWGGDWDYTDPMHIEIHMSPDQCAAFQGGTSGVSNLSGSADTSNLLGGVTGAVTKSILSPKLIALGAIVIVGGIVIFTEVSPTALAAKAIMK